MRRVKPTFKLTFCLLWGIWLSVGLSAQDSPTVSSFTPASLCQSDTLIINGSDFDLVKSIQIGDVLLTRSTWATNINFTQIEVFDLTNPNLLPGIYDLTLVGDGFRNTVGQVEIIQAAVIRIRTPFDRSSFCRGEEIELTVFDQFSFYNWSDGSTVPNTSLVLDETTTISLTVTDNNGCLATTQRTITAVDPPNVTIRASRDTVCRGDQVELTADSVVTATWSTGQNQLTITPVPLEDTVFFVAGRTAEGCQGSDSISIKVQESPTVEISGDLSICPGNSTELSASGAQTYQWSTGLNGDRITVTSAFDTLISVIGVDSAGCFASGEVLVDVTPVPEFTISGNATVCQGQSVLLTATANQNWSYQWGSNANNQTGALINVAPNQNTTYNLTVTDVRTGCFASGAKTVQIGDTLEVAVSGAGVVCQGETSTLSVAQNPNFSYRWNNGSTQPQISVAPDSTTLFRVTVTDSRNNCSGTSTAQVRVNPRPEARISGSSEICRGETVVLGASGGNAYQWDNGRTTAVIRETPQNTTTYSVTVSVGSACTDVATKMVTVKPVPQLEVQDRVFDICEGEPFTLRLIEGNNANGKIHSWTATGDEFVQGFSDGGGDLIQATYSNDRNVIGNVFYAIEVEQNGCNSRVDTLAFRINPKPEVSFDADLFLCSGEATSAFLNSDISSTTFSWTTSGVAGSGLGGGPNGSIIADVLTNEGNDILLIDYNVTSVTEAGCVGDPLVLTHWVYPEPELRANESLQVIQSGGMADIGFTTSQAVPVLGRWKPKKINGNITGVEEGVGESLTQVLELNGTKAWGEVSYEVESILITENEKVCTGLTDEVAIRVIPPSENGEVFIPNLFTPNGDGVNDTWGIEFDRTTNPEEFTVTVFSRNGTVVFPEQSLFIASQWDAANVPAGAYIYLLKGPESTFSGALTIQK